MNLIFFQTKFPYFQAEVASIQKLTASIVGGCEVKWRCPKGKCAKKNVEFPKLWWMDGMFCNYVI
jgi:hypothetical protein